GNRRKATHIAAFYLKRMEQINARFGIRTGNEVLLRYGQHLRTTLLRPCDELFRWGGPAFVAVLEREEPLPEVRREVGRAVSNRFDCEIRNGTAVVSVSVTNNTFTTESQDAAVLVGKINEFVLASCSEKSF